MENRQPLLEQAVAAWRQKDFASARVLLKQLLKQEPNNIDAWLLGALVVETRADAIKCYERALQVDPAHAYARKKLSQLQSEQSFAAPSTSPPVRSVAPTPQTSQPASRPASQPPVESPEGQTASKSSSANWLLVLGGILLGLFCLGLVGVAISSASELSQPAVLTPTDEQLFSVLYRNSRAANSEDLVAYMATIHPKSPGYRQTETTLREMFVDFDLEFYFYGLSVVSVNSNEAKLRFSLSTRKLAGPSFRDNIVTGTMTLRPDEGVWKIYGQDVEDVQYK